MALLEGTLDDDERIALLDEVAQDPALAADLEAASLGWLRMEVLATRAGEGGLARATGAGSSPTGAAPGLRSERRRVPAWWIPAAVAATVALVAPLTLRWAGGPASSPAAPPGASAVSATLASRPPASREPSYMLVLQGVWPDRAALSPAEVSARAEEYWDYVGELVDEGVLVAAGDLRFDGGRRLGEGPVRLLEAAEIRSPDHLVGILTLRVDSYEEALEVARRSPHLRYGGSVTVREVGLGFVAVPGMDDWSD